MGIIQLEETQCKTKGMMDLMGTQQRKGHHALGLRDKIYLWQKHEDANHCPASNLTWIDWITHYSFCQLTVSNISSKLLTAPPMTDNWSLITYHYKLSCLLADWMSGTTYRVLHLAEKIISCLLLISALLFYLLFEEEVKTLDPPQQVQGCSNAHWVRSGGRTPPDSPVTTNRYCLPSSQPFLAFGLLSFPDGCNQLGLRPFLRELKTFPS